MPNQISNFIFYGPAGTGKTVTAKRRAVEVIDGSAPADPSDPSVSQRFTQLVNDGRIFAVTLHPSYSYPDWVEGYRPVADDNGNLYWRVEPGKLRQAVAACGSSLPGFAAYFSPGQTLNSSTGSAYDIKSVDPYRVTLVRHDRRKNLVSKEDQVHFADVQTCIDKGVEPRELSYSGADEENRTKRADVAQRLDWSTTKLTNSGGLRAVYEHVLKRQAEGPVENQPVVLFIDEINRADPGRLWGEAITILEPNKRQGQPEEQPVELQFSGDRLVLPANLHILGTMNSADRSIAQFDVAYRRRFDFIWIGPDSSLVEDYAGIDLPALLDRVNLYLRRELGRDRQVGHAELMKRKLEARRAEHGWDGAPDGDLRAAALVLRVWLVPLLRDLLGNDLVRVQRALGLWGDLIEVVDDELASGESDDLWVDEREVLDDSGDWWDPLAGAWDADRVRAALHCSTTPATVTESST